jgi:hypothetical protein
MGTRPITIKLRTYDPAPIVDVLNKIDKMSADQLKALRDELIEARAMRPNEYADGWHDVILSAITSAKAKGTIRANVGGVDIVIDMKERLIYEDILEEQRIPMGALIDLLLPPDRAEELLNGLQDVYERRWIVRYTKTFAKLICRVHIVGVIFSYHSSKVSKFIGALCGLLGLKKLMGWFS